MKLKFYRGITLQSISAEMVIKTIKTNGLNGEEGDWTFSAPDVSDVRKHLAEILSANNPSIDEFFEKSTRKGICACGDEDGAKYYALKHNRTKEKTVPVVISFTTDMDRVYVDCRDFLCTVFQLWDRQTVERIKRQKAYLRALYGEAVITYFDKCIQTSDQKVRIAMGNLAAFDENVILSHYRNDKLIGGRHGTRFSSAFFVQAPISASEIDTCKVIDDNLSEKDIFVDLDSFIGKP